MNELYTMKLHDVTNIDYNISVRRVPGGWIYTEYVENGTGGHDMLAVFVPYSDEM